MTSMEACGICRCGWSLNVFAASSCDSASAIAYSYGQVARQLIDKWGPHGEWVAHLNPVLTCVITFQRVLYNPNFNDADEKLVLQPHPYTWYVTILAIDAAVALVLLYGALALFSRLEDNFAEEI